MPTPQLPQPSAGAERVCWHHVRAFVPAGWEVTAYSVEDRAGRLEFGTREGLMGIVSWEPCEREPDRATTMLAFLRNNVLGKESGNRLVADALRTAKLGAFELGWIEQEGPCQALAYAPERRKLIRWIFEPLAAKGRDWRPCAAPILESCDFNEGPAAEYQLHGIHALLPREYAIEDVVVSPANVMMSFESSASRRRATFRRWGLPEMLLGGGSLAAFHARILKTGGCAVQRSEPCRVDGMEGVRSVYDSPREHHMDRFMGRRWHNGAAVLWYDRAMLRLHAFEQIGPDASEPLDFAAVLPGRTLSPA